MKKLNYRHYICIAITIAFVCTTVFVFPHAFGRIIESIRDFGLSVAFYFCELLHIPYDFEPTVNSYPQMPFFPFLENYETPIATLPETWDGFVISWQKYWQQWVSKDNFFNYIKTIGNVLYNTSYFLLIFLPLIFVIIILFKKYLKTENNKYNKDSLPLTIFKKLAGRIYRPVKIWISNFLTFLAKHKAYTLTWLILWLFNFNIFTIVIEFLAFYFYFVISFDFLSIYKQLYKLCLDLWTVVNFIPGPVWIIIGILVVNKCATNIAYDRLRHNEKRNRGFLNSLSTTRIASGYMSAGKTTLITDISLSDEVQMLDDAFEIILETDMHFPQFPWINLENAIKTACRFHAIYDIPSVRRWIRKKYNRWAKNPCNDKIFNYDYERYGLSYDDKLKLINVWEALEEYACAYFIYTIQSSYIIANYSIRSDKLISDLGNFPIWNTDFFKRDSRLIDSYSRHAHILDYDMLRLGKFMLKNNPNRYAFGFGVYVISEIDKERKNSPELSEVKRNVEECNQKNDLVNTTIKMSRHACVVANRVFDRINADLQRTGSLNADFLELGDNITIISKSDLCPVLPFFSTYYLFDLIYRYLKYKFDKFYIKYRHNRADNTLFLYIFKCIIAKLSHYHERINNLFGVQKLILEIAHGKEIKQCKWYRMPKKIYSKRFATNCLSGIFEERAQFNHIGINDLREYESIMASNYELGLQNSHFWKEIKTLNSNCK